MSAAENNRAWYDEGYAYARKEFVAYLKEMREQIVNDDEHGWDFTHTEFATGVIDDILADFRDYCPSV